MPNFLLKSVIEIYFGKKKKDNYQNNIQLIAETDKAVLYYPHYSKLT